MKRFIYFLFLGFFLFSLNAFSGGKTDYTHFIKSNKDARKTGLLFRDPRTNPKARRVLKIYPEKGAPDYRKGKATSVDNSEYLPPVGSQGSQNCCTAWAVGYYFKSYQENRENNRTDLSSRSDSHNICSPAFIYNMIHAEGDNGSYMEDAMNVLNTFGCASLYYMPYDDSDYTTWPSTLAYKDAMYRKTITPTNGYEFNYLELDGDADLDSLKQLLLNGEVVVFGINVYDNYLNISDYNNIYALADKTGSNYGGHAQCIVGFDDTIQTPDGTGAFKVVNSWGDNWGDHGFYWITYEAVKYGSDYSFGYVFWVEDRNNYQPQYYTLINITHPYSRETRPYIVTSTNNRLDFLDFYVNQDDYEYLAYPPGDIAIDVSDLDPANADYITLYVEDITDVTNGKGGTINKFGFVTVSTGDEIDSTETPVDFADNTTGQATVYFTGTDYTITAIAHEGGTINPNGNVLVHEGTSKTFVISPDEDFHILDVKVDGNSVGPVHNYTFQNISSDHTIEAFFEHDDMEYTIHATAGEGGVIEPSGDVVVEKGQDKTFTITPDEGYFINDVIVDSHSVGRVSEYTFTNVQSSHIIHARFSTSLPPEITEAKVNYVDGTAPVSATFTCDAHDPDGGGIVEYIWQLNNDPQQQVITYTNTCNYTFSESGSYTVKVTVVDDEGETASATLKDNHNQDANIVVHRPTNLNIPITVMLNSGKFKGVNIVNAQTVLINEFLTAVNIKVKFYNENKELIDSVEKVIPPLGKFIFNPDDFGVSGYTDVVVEADNFLLGYSAVKTENGLMTASIIPAYSGSLYIPHIAEETDYWDTETFVYDLNPGGLKLKLNGNESSTTVSNFCNLINMEDYIGDNITESKMWGTVETSSNNPFVSSPRSIIGFEMFVHNGTDGAGVELESEGHTTLFIPHIPEETSIFWTGFAIVNTENSDANLKVDFYSSGGEKIGTETLVIPAKSKLKGLMSDLFPSENGLAEWGIIHSDRKLIGVEIYGTNDAGICGYSLPSLAQPQGILPFVITGENNWSGIAITNPGNQSVNVSIQLISKSGEIKASKTETIQPMSRFKAVLSDYFSDVSIEDGDYIKYTSSGAVVGIIVNGDKNRTFMSALIGRK